VAGHKPDAVACHTVPEPDAPVAGASGHIIRVGMEVEAVHVGEMSVKYPQRLRMFRGPEPRRSVVAAGGKVIAEGRELNVPDGEDVTLVADKAGPGLEAPQSDRSVFATRQ
jgi:hypothetical protein